MDGERATRLYVDALLGAEPEFQDEEEAKYYAKIKEEIEEAKEKYGSNLMFDIPND